MKKFLIILLCLAVLVSVSAACVSCTNSESDGKLKIVTTIFPVYDWTRQIIGNTEAEITMLIDTGVDLHSYQPTAADIMKIATCDVFIYIGGESDEWVGDALKQSVNKNLIAVNLMELLGDMAKEEVKIGDESADEECEYDEHIWLSLKNAEVLCRKICDILSGKSPESADIYDNNLKSYCEKLSALDKQYADAVEASDRKTLVFGDRFPFMYLADDYGLTCFAAFSGCSAEIEASFETIIYLAGKVDEYGLNSVLAIEGSKHKIAETVISNTKNKNQQVITLDSMQSVTSADVSDGETYLSIMEKNLTALIKALK